MRRRTTGTHASQALRPGRKMRSGGTRSAQSWLVRCGSTVLVALGIASATMAATAHATPGSWTEQQVQEHAEKALAYVDSFHKPSGSVEFTAPLAPVVETGIALIDYGLMARGNFANLAALSPGYPAHAEEAIRWLLTQQNANGSWEVAGTEQTYSTGNVLAGLGVFVGMPGLTPIPGMAAAISNGRAYLEKEFRGTENGFTCTGTQEWCGGWNYDPDPLELRSDQSNTGFALFGLQETGGVPPAIAAQNVVWQRNIQAIA